MFFTDGDIMLSKNDNNISVSRNSRLEFLRIIAILMIVFCHFSTHGFIFNNFSFNKYYLNALQFGGEFGVNIFVMISAYFSINKKENYKKIIKLVFCTLFYSVTFLILFLCFSSLKSISITDVFKSLLPISYRHYWFITDFILLMIVSPFLNKMIKVFEKDMYKKFIFISFTFLCVFCVFLPKSFVDIKNGFIWFIYLYFCVGYIKNMLI